MNLEIILEKVGFSKEEAKIYLALLELGEANLKEISDVSGIPRTSLYNYIQRKIESGVIQYYRKNGKKIYVAISPDKLFKATEKNVVILKENLKHFQGRMRVEPSKPQVRFFEGSSGIKLMFEEILEDKHPFFAITSIDDINVLIEYAFKKFVERRIQQRLPVKLITNRSAASQQLKEADDKEFRITRFVPSDYKFHTANYIFGDKVAIISLKQKYAIGTITEDKDIAQTNKMYFDLIWKMASSR